MEQQVTSYAFLYQVTGFLPYQPHPNDNAIRKALKRYFPANCLVGVVTYYLLIVSYSLRLIQERFVDVEYLAELIVAHGMTIRYLIFRSKRDQLRLLLARCESLWSQLVRDDGDTLVMKSYTSVARYFKLFFASTILISLLFYLLTTILVRLPPQEVNGTEVRILILKVYVDAQSDPLYSLVTSVEFTAISTMAVLIVAFETICPLLVMLACGYLRILRNRLYSATSEVDRDERIRICALFHAKTLGLCATIERFTAHNYLVQVATSVYNCALLGFVLLSKNPNYLKQLSLLIFAMLQFFACNWVPELLLNESQAVAEAAYAACLVSPSFSVSTNRMLLLMIVRAQKPAQLTAGGYVRLSLENFKQMTMSALSFFTVLRRILSQED